ncbi:hypothetical protein [Cupriavidus sp. UYPR2.512]|uniref:hypothetical protein n=1 Tax=Cupriavidus sp. UYPR2.512 TaxID=1080187 RepID=UPI0005617363|nr:hypothetical protein [Cupriavidus sp. UYPR2.512]UIF88418.1 hypothetical protein KAF44_23615 [Cupriavidus necator]
MAGQEAKQWNRDTKWRQGNVLPLAAMEHFLLSYPGGADAHCVVVVSHDCDLANDNLTVEPDVEVIVGRIVQKVDGNFTWGKAPRTLHYAATRGGEPVHIELVSTRKQSIAKSELARFEPDETFGLDGKSLAVLRSWLGSRYNRAAFPDAFVKRMASTKADSKLSKALEKSSELISFVYFDVDAGKSIERKEGDPYQLGIVLVFAPGEDVDASAEAADRLATEIEDAVRLRLQDGKFIVLKACFSISEDDLPVSRARTLTQWRLEYMTLKADDDQLGPPIL